MGSHRSRSLIIVEIQWNTKNHLLFSIFQLSNVSRHCTKMFFFTSKPVHILGPIESMGIRYRSPDSVS